MDIKVNFKMAAAAILEVVGSYFLRQTRLRGGGILSYIIMHTFVQICQRATELWRLKQVSIWRPPPSWILAFVGRQI